MSVSPELILFHDQVISLLSKGTLKPENMLAVIQLQLSEDHQVSLLDKMDTLVQLGLATFDGNCYSQRRMM